jgi:hypothetical protein
LKENIKSEKNTAEIITKPILYTESFWVINNTTYTELRKIWSSLKPYVLRNEIKEEAESFRVIIRNKNNIRWILRDNMVIRINIPVLEIKEDSCRKMFNLVLRSMPDNIYSKVKPFVLYNKTAV